MNGTYRGGGWVVLRVNGTNRGGRVDGTYHGRGVGGTEGERYLPWRRGG